MGRTTGTAKSTLDRASLVSSYTKEARLEILGVD